VEERKREDMRPLGGTDSRAHGSRSLLAKRSPARVEQPQSSDQGEDKRLVVWIPLG